MSDLYFNEKSDYSEKKWQSRLSLHHSSTISVWKKQQVLLKEGVFFLPADVNILIDFIFLEEQLKLLG